MHEYSSRDFGKTKAEIECQVPERLIHRGVEETGLIDSFSGERKHPVFVVDLPTKTMSVTIGHLGVGQSTRLHRHTYETVLYILEGSGRTWLGEREVPWEAGDAVYVPVWAWHRHENTGSVRVRYVACENAPLLQNLGGLALREESIS